MDQDLSNSIIRNAFRLWFEPEMERRRADGRLDATARVWAAQVLLEVDGPPIVRFNEELRGVYAVRTAQTLDGVKAGDVVALPSVTRFESLVLTEAEPNAGHLTVIFNSGGAFLAFDFRYNARRIKHCLDRALEFLNAASSALRKKHYSAFWENLFAAVELMAKSLLLARPDRSLLGKPPHRHIKASLNQDARLGNLPSEFTGLLNDLSRKRDRARYGDGIFMVNHDVAHKMLTAARKFYGYADRNRPRRHGER